MLDKILIIREKKKTKSQTLNNEAVEFTLNGKLTRVLIRPKDLLSEVLREKLGLMSAKIACDEGTCGSCTVLLDGEPVYSCIVLGLDCNAKSVETLEGLSEDGQNLTPLQESFLTTNSAQCGFCTPGMIMSAKSLLDKNSEPTREEVKVALSGNVCRCTDYSRYINAVLLAAKKIRSKAPNA
ncbi:MAG TPA: (2Fe-2S)-binding protein [Nitrososphaerales archaeon]|nr:(2Fe-2S)-binding protein [Nitrososphaerales archaeon]